MKKLSVIIPVYNVEPYLARCIESVVTESEIPYEIVIVNDGSTDGSAAVAERYRARYPELISVVTTENRGLGSARNTGMEHSSGEYLYFLDSDDYLAPGGMDGILACLEEDFALCFFNSVTVTEDGRELKTVQGCKAPGEISLDAYPELLLEIPNVWNKIFRRRLFTEHDIRFPGRAWFEDVRTVLKLYAFAAPMIYKPEAWHRYLLRGGSITNSKKALRNREMIEAVDDLFSFYRQQGRWEQLKPVLEYFAFYNEFLTSSVRANLADWRSPVQEELMLDFLGKFPDFQQNPYVQKIPPKYKLLTWLLLHRMRLSVHLIMQLNNLVRDKGI